MSRERQGPCVYISNLPRTTTRAVWKWLYRLMRVTARETEKAHKDMLIFGTGVVAFNDDENPKHIPINEVRFYS